MGRLFGTDGIRGVAGEFPLTAEDCLRIGQAVASFFCEQNTGPMQQIVIGKDTRQSGAMIETALTEGIRSVGADVLLAGILPTPAVARVVASNKATAGIVISASHNPYTDNGIKIFGGNGEKLSGDVEHQLETHFFQLKQSSAIDDPPAAEHFLERMNTEVDALTQIVTEFLELTRIESGQAPLKIKSTKPCRLIKKAAKRMKEQAKRAIGL